MCVVYRWLLFFLFSALYTCSWTKDFSYQLISRFYSHAAIYSTILFLPAVLLFYFSIFHIISYCVITICAWWFFSFSRIVRDNNQKYSMENVSFYYWKLKSINENIEYTSEFPNQLCIHFVSWNLVRRNGGKLYRNHPHILMATHDRVFGWNYREKTSKLFKLKS